MSHSISLKSDRTLSSSESIPSKFVCGTFGGNAILEDNDEDGASDWNSFSLWLDDITLELERCGAMCRMWKIVLFDALLNG